MSKKIASKAKNIKNFKIDTSQAEDEQNSSSNVKTNAENSENATSDSSNNIPASNDSSGVAQDGVKSKEASKFENKKIRAIKSFTDKAASAGRNLDEDEQTDEEDKYGSKYQTDLNKMSSSVTDSAKRVRDIVDDLKRKNRINSGNGRNSSSISNVSNNSNVNGSTSSMTNPADDKASTGRRKNDGYRPAERKPIVDNKNVEKVNDAHRKDFDYDKLDKKFAKPKKKEPLSKALKRKRDEWLAKKKKEIAVKKSKGFLNLLVEKITGESAKGILGFVIKILLVIVLILLLIAMLVAVIFFFSNNYTREQDTVSDSKRLDTRVARAIYAFAEETELKNTYAELIKNATGDERIRLNRNLARLIPSDEVEKLKSAEDPQSAFILQDSANWVLLYLERLSYAWGGYLEWLPEYIDLGVNMSGREMRDANEEMLEVWRPLCTEIGAEYGIDPALLMAIIDIESSGNPHAENESYKGLCALPAEFNNYFKEGEEFYTWDETMRVPTDLGTCDMLDEVHQKNARLHITYLARRLTKQAGSFLNNIKGISVSSASDYDKSIAMMFSIAAYNQGEARQRDFYETYGNKLYEGDGLYYTRMFEKHLNTPLNGGYYSEGEGNKLYVQLAYKFYKVYSGGSDLSDVGENTTSRRWYEVNTSLNERQTEAAVPGDVEEEVKLVAGSTETELINEIRKQYYQGELTYILNQYNRWMSKFDNYYRNNYPDKFLTDVSGNLIPDIYAKDIYGVDTTDVIKHQSYIHNIINTISTYTTTRTYEADSLQDAYVSFKNDLYNEVNDGSPNVTKELSEPLNTLEDELALNRYELSFEVIRTVDADNDILHNNEALDIIQDSLSYSVPIYEYATTNTSEAAKTFFDYEIYSPSFYNNDYTLIVQSSKFLQMINSINNINISMKSFVTNGWSSEGQASIENRMESAFELMYLNNNKAYEPRNHSVEIPSDLSYYYIVNNNKVYDKMIEKVRAVEVYLSEDVPSDADRVEWTETSSGGSTEFKEIETTVIRDYYLSSLKPTKYTSLKYQVDFDYIKEEEGDKDIDSKSGDVKYYRGTVYITKENEDGEERTETKTIYKTEITKTNYYIVEKVRNKTISKRGVTNEE